MRGWVGKRLRIVLACLLMLATPTVPLVSAGAFAGPEPEVCGGGTPDGHRHHAVAAAELPDDLRQSAIHAHPGCGAGGSTGDSPCCLGVACIAMHGGLPVSMAPSAALPRATANRPPGVTAPDGIEPDPSLRPPKALA